jgi:archaellum component FlaC
MSNDEMSTKPTIETVLERINSFALQFENRFNQVDAQLKQFDARFEAVEQRLTSIEKHHRRIDIRLDRVESITLDTRSSLEDLRDQLTEHMPQIK